jgi:hypothetical protein
LIYNTSVRLITKELDLKQTDKLSPGNIQKIFDDALRKIREHKLRDGFLGSEIMDLLRIFSGPTVPIVDNGKVVFVRGKSISNDQLRSIQPTETIDVVRSGALFDLVAQWVLVRRGKQEAVGNEIDRMELTREEFDAARQMLIEVYIDGASSRFGVSSYKAVVSISEGANKALMHALDNFDEAIDIFKISLSEQGLRIIEHDSRSMVERLAEIMKPE